MKHSSRETSFFFDYFFSFFAFLSKKTKHLLASFFSGRSAAQNDEMMMIFYEMEHESVRKVIKCAQISWKSVKKSLKSCSNVIKCDDLS